MAEVAHALWVDEDAALKELADGRVSSRWAEHWGARVGNILKSTNSNEPGYDLSAVVSDMPIRVSNKCLTKSGVKFQDSRFVGSGRNCTLDDLKQSLDDNDLVQVVDITEVPKIRLVTVRARDLREEADSGNLTPSGWKREKFYEFLEHVYDVKVVAVVREEGTEPLVASQAS
ncbi:MAG TPA: hypothetical protein VFB42_06640 [Gaiellaceae bacterium]|nr:hypothetical protein [Gaiellaceae bacterium]